jgi:YesN/AraC family two-component response regulator
MPVMDGLAFCKEVCSRKLNIIIILLTGYKDFEFARSAIEYGVRKYLLKPTDHKEIAELFTRIREELNCATHAFGLKNNEKEIIIKSGNYYDRIINNYEGICAKQHPMRNFGKRRRWRKPPNC